MKRVRFAPSPTGPLHVGNALTAVINRRLGDRLLLRIDDTDGENALITDLEWLGISWDEGPARQSERHYAYRAAVERLGGSATYHLASVVDDIDFGITHVICGNDQRPNEALHRRLHEAVPALRGARNFEGARAYARIVSEPEPARVAAPETFVRFGELYANETSDPKEVLRELKAVGGDLRALRLALTGRERGPELAAVLASIPREEALRRVGAAL